MDCTYCKRDTEMGQFCSDGDFICNDCIEEIMEDDDE